MCFAAAIRMNSLKQIQFQYRIPGILLLVQNVYTQLVESIFCLSWLATQTQDRICYSREPGAFLDLTRKFSLISHNKKELFGAGRFMSRQISTTIHLQFGE